MKPVIAISCPIDTFSGYGARSRDVVKALINSEKYEVKILSQRWGSTPFGFLKPSNPDHKKIIDCIQSSNNKLEGAPDIWIQITVPNEFQKVGKYNIGITAGIETDLCATTWIEGCNRMDLVLTSCNHSKKVFLNSKYEQRKKDNPEEVVGIIETTVPVEVLFEGVDTQIYKKTNKVDETLDDILKSIPEHFNFLVVGHWLQGSFGEDRKNMGGTIKAFLETFKNRKIKPGLILKVNGGNYSIMDRDQMIAKIEEVKSMVDGDLPNIYLLHGELTDDEMNGLYNHSKVKAMLSLTKGEGYGRPLIEFTQAQKPIVVSGWSGHTDFLSKEFSVFVGGEIKPIDKSAVVENMLIAESKWFTPDYNQASLALKAVYADYDEYVEKAKRQSYICRNDFSLEKMGERLVEILDANFTKEIPLPKLSKTTLPTLNKAEDDK
jgi:glycosyltransferase involved in cell wall biosynthesis